MIWINLYKIFNFFLLVGSPGHTGKSGPGGILSIEVELLAAVAAGVARADKEEVVDGRDASRVTLGVVGYVVIPAGPLVRRHHTEGRARLKLNIIIAINRFILWGKKDYNKAELEILSHSDTY